jgi:hypothetical protein
MDATIAKTRWENGVEGEEASSSVGETDGASSLFDLSGMVGW